MVHNRWKNDEDRSVCLSFCSTSTIPLGSSPSSGDGDGMVPIAGKQRFAPKLDPVAWKRCSRDIPVWKRCVWGLRSGTRDSWEWDAPSLLPSVPSVAAPECSFLPETLPWLGKADLK